MPLFGGLLLWAVGTGISLAAGSGQDIAPGEGSLPYLYVVYTVTWVAFFAYAFYVSRRQRDLRREIEQLRRALDEKAK